MSHPNKKWGSEYERFCRARTADRGLEVLDLAEGGMYDPGDWAFELPTGDWLIAESKAAAKLSHSPHNVLAKAIRKASTSDLPFAPLGAVLFWKRLVKNDNGRRVKPAGDESEVVIMSTDLFYDLISLIDEGV